MYSKLFLNRTVAFHAVRRFASSFKVNPAEYCLQLVRKYDYENFLCSLFLPFAEPRAAAFAIRAFNVEMALVEDQVHDYKIGEMRFRFWTDAVNSTFEGKPPNTPVTLELHRVLQKHKLSKRYFHRLIDSRLERLGSSDFPNVAAMERYSEYSVSSVYYLLLEAYGITKVEMDHIASHLGKAHGILTLLRSIPHNAKNRKNVLPLDVMVRHGVCTEDIFQGKVKKNVIEAVYDVLWYVRNHLDTVMSLSHEIKEPAKAIFLPMVAMKTYLDRMHHMEYDIFHPHLQSRRHMLAVLLAWHRMMTW